MTTHIPDPTPAKECERAAEKLRTVASTAVVVMPAGSPHRQMLLEVAEAVADILEERAVVSWPAPSSPELRLARLINEWSP